MRSLIVALSLLLAACGTTTSVVRLDPTRQYPPTESVQILFEPPQKPYEPIARLESVGNVGAHEPEVLEDARERARALGADALIVLDVDRTYYPPIVTYDYDPWPYLNWYPRPWYGYRDWSYAPPFGYGWQPRMIPGGHAYTVRSMAIRYK